jgi:protease I
MTLRDRSIAVLTYPGYQELEFWYPVLRAREEGATVSVVAAGAGECESHLGYPVVGDTDGSGLGGEHVDALVVPGTVEGAPAVSEAQRHLVTAVHAAGRPVYAIGTGTQVVTDLIGELPAGHAVPDADALPEFVRHLISDLAVDD